MVKVTNSKIETFSEGLFSGIDFERFHLENTSLNRINFHAFEGCTAEVVFLKHVDILQEVAREAIEFDRIETLEIANCTFQHISSGAFKLHLIDKVISKIHVIFILQLILHILSDFLTGINYEKQHFQALGIPKRVPDNVE